MELNCGSIISTAYFSLLRFLDSNQSDFRASRKFLSSNFLFPSFSLSFSFSFSSSFSLPLPLFLFLLSPTCWIIIKYIWYEHFMKFEILILFTLNFFAHSEKLFHDKVSSDSMLQWSWTVPKKNPDSRWSQRKGCWSSYRK